MPTTSGAPLRASPMRSSRRTRASRIWPSSASSRAAPLWPNAWRACCSRSRAWRCRSASSTSASIATTTPTTPAGFRPCCPAPSFSTSPTGASFWWTTCSLPGAPCARPSPPCWIWDARPPSNWPPSWIGGIGSCPSVPISWGRTFPPRARSMCRCAFRRPMAKIACLSVNPREDRSDRICSEREPKHSMKHLLALRETSAENMRYLLDSAAVFKEILARPVKKVPTLRGRIMVTLFYENSTRTRTSFELAAKIMSAEAINIAVAQSSVAKGESLKDTVLTLQSLKADCIVMRHYASGAAQFAADHLQSSVINAGDGRHEHPTQGLLDLFTIRQNKGEIEGLTVAIVGDILHSRVARSNIWGLTKLGAKVRLVGPRTLLPPDADRLPVEVYDNLRTGLEGADVVNVLRL